jgi:hypothetical protein
MKNSFGVGGVQYRQRDYHRLAIENNYRAVADDAT